MTSEELITAAKIANPWETSDLSTHGPAEVEAAGRILADQKVSLLGLPERYGKSVAPLGDLIEADQKKFKKLREEFECLRKAFAGAGVKTLFLKSTGLYPGFHYLSSNLDVMIPADGTAAARRILAERGYVELLNVEEPRKFLFRRFTGDGFSFTFHMHEVVGWGVPFVDTDAMWRNARPAKDDPDITIPGPVEALLVTLAHWFYEDKSLSLGNLLSTAHAVRNVGRPLEEPAGEAARRGWAEGYWAALSIFDRSWKSLYKKSFLDDTQLRSVERALEQFKPVGRRLLPRVAYGGKQAASIPFFLNKVFYYRKVIRDPSRNSLTKVRDVAATLLWAVRWKLHVRSHKPLLVTVSGCDGSGKTLQVKRLEQTFKTCDVRTRVVWARGASSRFMGLFITAAKNLRSAAGGSKHERTNEERSIGAATDAEKMAHRRHALQNPLVRFAFGVLYAADLGWTYCVKIRLLKLTGCVVITDRYVYDGLVDFSLLSGRRVDKPPLALRWLLRLAPRPDVGVVLDVEPAEALRRKPEEGSTDYLDEARRSFTVLSDKENLELVSAGRAPDEIQRSIALWALTRFYKNYRTVINWLLFSNPDQLNPRGRAA